MGYIYVSYCVELSLLTMAACFRLGLSKWLAAIVLYNASGKLASLSLVQSRIRYLAAFENMLQYTRYNFNNIMELKSSAHMANYDAYYLRYRSVADAHNRVNKKRVEFQNKFIQEHPKVKPVCNRCPPH